MRTIGPQRQRNGLLLNLLQRTTRFSSMPFQVEQKFTIMATMISISNQLVCRQNLYTHQLHNQVAISCCFKCQVNRGKQTICKIEVQWRHHRRILVHFHPPMSRRYLIIILLLKVMGMLCFNIQAHKLSHL